MEKNREHEMETGVLYGVIYDGFHREGDPNIDPNILYSLLWASPNKYP